MRKLAAILFALLFLAPAPPSLAAEDDAVVVELFTSQACPACPPAETYLRELALRPDIIALEYHIDYYDYAGWKDPFGQAMFTRRWHDYADALKARYEYTPFLVVAGAAHMVGSERAEIERHIREQRKEAGEHPHLTVAMAEDVAVVTIDGHGPPGTYDVNLAAYDGERETVVTAGENRGKTLVSINVVRDLRRIAQWAGDPVTVRVPIHRAAGGGCAVLLQRGAAGPILAAASANF